MSKQPLQEPLCETQSEEFLLHDALDEMDQQIGSSETEPFSFDTTTEPLGIDTLLAEALQELESASSPVLRERPLKRGFSTLHHHIDVSKLIEHLLR